MALVYLTLVNIDANSCKKICYKAMGWWGRHVFFGFTRMISLLGLPVEKKSK
jgi:hypothetical protein